MSQSEKVDLPPVEDKENVEAETGQPDPEITGKSGDGERSNQDEGEEEEVVDAGIDGREGETDTTIYGRIEDFLMVNQKKIDLGSTLPGQVKEEDLQIAYPKIGKNNYQLKIEVKVICESQRFDDLDEYVFGLRKPPNFDFNDTFIIKMEPDNKITLRCAVKIPNVKEEMPILGKIKMECPNLEGKIIIPVSANVHIVSLFCPKILYGNGVEAAFFNLTKTFRQEIKLPLRYHGLNKIYCEFFFLKGEEDPGFSFQLPNPAFIYPKTPLTLNIIVKQTIGQMDPRPNNYEIRKILVVKILNTSMLFSFPLLFRIKNTAAGMADSFAN